MRLSDEPQAGWVELAGRVTAYAADQTGIAVSSRVEDQLTTLLAELLRVLANWPAGGPPSDVWSTMRRHWGDRTWLRDLLGQLPLSARRMLLGVDRDRGERFLSVVEYALDGQRARPAGLTPGPQVRAIWRRALSEIDG